MSLPNLASVLDMMDRTPGFFYREEGHSLIEAALRAMSVCKPPHSLVEIGSYAGRTAIGLGFAARFVGGGAKAYAVDPHDGTLCEPPDRIVKGQPTLDAFNKAISDAGLWDVVELVHKKSFEVVWDRPISMIFIDGLHDYENVSRDYRHFERWLSTGAVVAFHDYSPAFPGVQRFVDGLLNDNVVKTVELVSSLLVTQRCG